MSKAYDLTRQRFGKLTVIQKATTKKSGQLRWECICDCGNKIETESWSLRKGLTKSCGCFALEHRRQPRLYQRTHGEGSNGKETTEYKTWAAMLSRCNNPNHKAFAYYGGRGITVCASWHSYENFLADMGRKPDPTYSLDRIDNSLGYEPKNCRWADAKTQMNNRRPAHLDKATSVHQLFEHAGKTCKVVEWLKLTQISQNTYRQRIREGMTPEQAIFTPLKYPNRKPRTRRSHSTTP